MPPLTLHRRRLLDFPLPRPDPEGDKEERGRVLLVGGARELPGAVILAGTAALRAGAGKVQIATGEGIALRVGASLPEARVFSLLETAAGGIASAAAGEIVGRAEQARAVLLGPGMVDAPDTVALTRAIVGAVSRPALALDAGALSALSGEPGALRHLRGRAVLTPHAGEMARILGMERAAVEADPLGVAMRAARETGAVVVLKGAQTHIATPEGAALRYALGRVGLATSGSGDALSGVVAGLLARGADALTAAAWGVYLHGEAGNVLARRMGEVGFLARELLDEVPRILQRLR